MQYLFSAKSNHAIVELSGERRRQPGDNRLDTSIAISIRSSGPIRRPELAVDKS